MLPLLPLIPLLLMPLMLLPLPLLAVCSSLCMDTLIDAAANDAYAIFPRAKKSSEVEVDSTRAVASPCTSVAVNAPPAAAPVARTAAAATAAATQNALLEPQLTLPSVAAVAVAAAEESLAATTGVAEAAAATSRDVASRRRQLVAAVVGAAAAAGSLPLWACAHAGLLSLAHLTSPVSHLSVLLKKPTKPSQSMFRCIYSSDVGIDIGANIVTPIT